MVILYIYSTYWRMKSVFYERQHRRGEIPLVSLCPPRHPKWIYHTVVVLYLPSPTVFLPPVSRIWPVDHRLAPWPRSPALAVGCQPMDKPTSSYAELEAAQAHSTHSHFALELFESIEMDSNLLKFIGNSNNSIKLSNHF
jgi:hypothetical protein